MGQIALFRNLGELSPQILFTAILTIAGFIAFDIAMHLGPRRGISRVAGAFAAALPLGFGIWQLRYNAELPAPIPGAALSFAWPIVLLALGVTIAAACVAFLIVSQPSRLPIRAVIGSIILGGGIAARYYIGAEALRFHAPQVRSPSLVALSIAVPIFGSFLALFFVFVRGERRSALFSRKLGAATVLGVATVVTSNLYAMAVSQMPNLSSHSNIDYSVSLSGLRFLGSSGATFLVLSLILQSFLHARRFDLKTRQLAESNERMQTLLDNLEEAVFLLARDGAIVQLNEPALRILGGLTEGNLPEMARDRLEMFRPNGEEFLPAESPGALALKGKFVQNVQVELRQKASRISTIHEVSTAPVKNKEGEISHVILRLLDVTEVNRTKVAEAEGARKLKESERLYQELFESLPAGVILQAESGEILEINAAACSIMNLSREQAMGKVEACPAERWIREDGTPYPMSKHPVPRCLSTGSPVMDETVGLDVAQERRWLKFTAVPLFRPNQTQPYACLSSFIDVTDRKRIEETRDKLAAIVESSPDAIYGENLQGIVQSWNKGAEEMLGYTAAEMIGHSIQAILPPDCEQEEYENLDSIRRGAMSRKIETVRRKKNGEFIHVALTVSAIRDLYGEIVGAAKIAKDITSHKLLEKQLYRSQKMQAIGQLTGGIAHDFNNLLGIVIGNLDLLERMVGGNQPMLKRVVTAQKAALRGADITRRMLAFSSREDLSPTSVQLEQAIQNTVEMISNALGPEINISTRIDKNIPSITVDAARLESALVNLAVNARDAMPTGGSLKIAAQLVNLEPGYPPVQAGDLKAGYHACISVSDSGQGMSQATIERAFEPFFTTKEPGKGTGLGLAMVYGFVKQSGGSVRLYSEEGHGTTVTIYLPVANDTPGPSPSFQEEVETLSDGRTVLVVDDELDLLELAVMYLKEMGYEVLQAASAAEGLATAVRHPEISVLLTDVIMPGGMNGVELSQRVSQLIPGVRTIFSSGFPADALPQSGTKVDGSFLRKPYQRSELARFMRLTMPGAGSNAEEQAPARAPGDRPATG